MHSATNQCLAPNVNKSLIVTTDVSDYAIEAILSQSEIDKNHPCKYILKFLWCRGQLRYPAYDNKSFAIVFTKKQFRLHLWNQKITVVTDYELLEHFHVSNKLDLHFARFKAKLRSCEFNVINRASKINTRRPFIKSMNNGETCLDLPKKSFTSLQSDKKAHGNIDALPAQIYIILSRCQFSKLRKNKKKRFEIVYDSEKNG